VGEEPPLPSINLKLEYIMKRYIIACLAIMFLISFLGVNSQASEEYGWEEDGTFLIACPGLKIKKARGVVTYGRNGPISFKPREGTSLARKFTKIYLQACAVAPRIPNSKPKDQDPPWIG